MTGYFGIWNVPAHTCIPIPSLTITCRRESAFSRSTIRPLDSLSYPDKQVLLWLQQHNGGLQDAHSSSHAWSETSASLPWLVSTFHYKCHNKPGKEMWQLELIDCLHWESVSTNPIIPPMISLFTAVIPLKPKTLESAPMPRFLSIWSPAYHPIWLKCPLIFNNLNLQYAQWNALSATSKIYHSLTLTFTSNLHLHFLPFHCSQSKLYIRITWGDLKSINAWFTLRNYNLVGLE